MKSVESGPGTGAGGINENDRGFWTSDMKYKTIIHFNNFSNCRDATKLIKNIKNVFYNHIKTYLLSVKL
jgi:hypothetical protein